MIGRTKDEKEDLGYHLKENKSANYFSRSCIFSQLNQLFEDSVQQTSIIENLDLHMSYFYLI